MAFLLVKCGIGDAAVVSFWAMGSKSPDLQAMLAGSGARLYATGIEWRLGSVVDSVEMRIWEPFMAKSVCGRLKAKLQTFGVL